MTKERVYTERFLKGLTKKQLALMYGKLVSLSESKGKRFEKTIIRIFECLNQKRCEAISQIACQPIAAGNFPIIPVINITSVGLEDQMKILGGQNIIIAKKIHEDMGLFKGFPSWWIIDVENGRQFRKTSPSPRTEVSEIKKQQRLCLLTPEIIALGVFTDTLKSHSLCAGDSKYAGENLAPFLWSGITGGKCMLDIDFPDFRHVACHTASCKTRV